MSVVLTACRHSKKRAIARALKRRAEKRALRNLQVETCPIDYKDIEPEVPQLSNTHGKLKKEAELQQLEEEEEAEAFTKMWSFCIHGQDFFVCLYLAPYKDTVDIFCNDEEVDNVITDVVGGDLSFDFLIGQSYKARICCNNTSHCGMVHSLTIDGYCIPEAQ